MTDAPDFDWNEAAVGTLKRMCREGRSASAIADVLGISRNAIIGKLTRLGMRLNGSPGPRQPRPASRKQRRPNGFAPKPSATAEPARAPPPAVVPRSSPCTILELTPDTCRWPMWRHEATVGDKDYGIYCGGMAIGGRYCVDHARIAFNSVRPC